jgi:predicted O-linked N-acetylglucosamine transferase (SPINDLY family)/glycosyltransferase involved in cell wall biosynthesis
MRIAFIDLSAIAPYTLDTPYTKGLGGTQSSMCYYAEELAKREHDVTLFLSRVDSPTKSRGVQILDATKLAGQSFDVVVWINSVLTSNQSILTKFKYGLSIVWVPHNTDEPAMNDFEDNLFIYDYFGFMSSIQRKKYIDLYNIPTDKTFLILNGINPGFIGDFDVTAKKQRFIYTPQPDRGLIHLLDIWPQIVSNWPEAELHTYGGRKNYGLEQPEGEKNLLDRVKSMKNCYVHEPVGQSELINILRESAIFIYPCDFYETGCITVTEAAAAGCLPIVTDLGVLGQYYSDAIHYDEQFKDKFVSRANDYLIMLKERPNEFYALSERLALRTQKERDYKNLVTIFLNNISDLLKKRVDSAMSVRKGVSLVNDKKFREARIILENMSPIFHKKSEAFEYYLNCGIACFYLKMYKNAISYWKIAHKYDETYNLCVNMLLVYEQLKDQKGMLEWAERSLKYKFESAVIFKVANYMNKLQYFERCKWGKYLISLYNNDIHNNSWLSFFVANGNMMSSDYSLVMKHEEGLKLLEKVIENTFASAKLTNKSIYEESDLRRNAEKLFNNLFLLLNYFITNNPTYFHYVKYYMENLPAKNTVSLCKFTPIASNRKLRLGFLSGDVKYHPVSYILNGLVKHINPNEFDVFVFSTSAKDDTNIMQKRIRDSCYYIDLNGESEFRLRDIIYEKDIDVLVEMSGHTSEGTQLINVMRHRPARVQANYFAFPNTYGIPECDYKIGDSIVFPPGLESYYVEKFCKLPNGLHTYNPMAGLTVKHSSHEGVVFGCTNNPKKYRSSWLKSVSNILKGVPNSRLVMRYFNLDDPSIQEFYWKEFEKLGIERKRVDLALANNWLNYFNTYADMDILLDPFPYNGGTINIETLYASLPYITLLGNSYVSRVGASILTQVGHTELIAKTQEEYVSLAIELGKSPERIAQYKQTLRTDFDKSTLGDNAAFAVEFMDGVKWMLKEKGWLTKTTPSVAYYPPKEAQKSSEEKKVESVSVTISSEISSVDTLLVSTNPAELPTKDDDVRGPTLVIAGSD